MKKTITLAAFAALAVSSAQAVTVAIANADFQGAQVDGNDPADWLTTDPWDTVYVWNSDEAGAPAGEQVGAFKDVSNTSILQQTVTDNNPTIFAETYGEWTVGFDYGWRANSVDGDAHFTVSLIDLATGFALASDTLTLSSTAATGGLPLGTASLTLSYDNSAATVANWVALRIERDDVADTTTGKWNSTAWIDDVTVTATTAAVPEPSSAALLGLGGLALILRRRK